MKPIAFCALLVLAVAGSAFAQLNASANVEAKHHHHKHHHHKHHHRHHHHVKHS